MCIEGRESLGEENNSHSMAHLQVKGTEMKFNLAVFFHRSFVSHIGIKPFLFFFEKTASN